MSGKLAAIAGVFMSISACAPQPRPIDTAPTAATTADARAMGTALANACTGRDGWSDAAPPARIFGNTYYVGTCGISVLLVASPDGHVLIDAATEAAVPAILDNIRSLGFDPRDVRLIVGSHEHADHMGGLAGLKAATGARLMLSAPARQVMESGRIDAADPQYGIPDMDMRPVAVDETLSAGQTVRAGRIELTAHATPGHTSGGTSWTWRSCEGPNCATFAYVDSLSAVSRDDYRFSDHPERVAPFHTTFQRIGQMPCDILVTPHPSVSNLFARLAGADPLIDRDACRRLVHQSRQRLNDRLSRESSQ